MGTHFWSSGEGKCFLQEQNNSVLKGLTGTLLLSNALLQFKYTTFSKGFRSAKLVCVVIYKGQVAMIAIRSEFLATHFHASKRKRKLPCCFKKLEN